MLEHLEGDDDRIARVAKRERSDTDYMFGRKGRVDVDTGQLAVQSLQG